MHPSFPFVWISILAALFAIRRWDRKRGNEPAAQAWSALAWVVFGMGLARVFVWDPVVVQGSSMLPTFHDSEVLIVDKRAFGLRVPIWGARLGGQVPQLGEVVVFDGPDGDNWIKRVAAVPGDRLVYMENRGWFRNGQFLAPEFQSEQPYWLLLRGARRLPVSGGRTWELPVPVDTVFVLGDNPSMSLDSRRIGLVPIDRLQGRVQ